MSDLEELVVRCIEKKKRLDDLKAHSQEMVDALAISDEYHNLLNDIREMCNPAPQAMPTPYPMRLSDNTCTTGMWPSVNIRLVK